MSSSEKTSLPTVVVPTPAKNPNTGRNRLIAITLFLISLNTPLFDRLLAHQGCHQDTVHNSAEDLVVAKCPAKLSYVADTPF